MKSYHSEFNHFITKTPKSLTKRRLFIFFSMSFFSLSTIIFYSYVMYTPINSLDFPSIKITCKNDVDIEDAENCIFELTSSNDQENIEPIKAKIKIRGGKSGVASYPKKGYRLKLSEEKSILGMEKDDDWHLMAMYLDYPRMRIKTAYELWDSLSSDNPTAISLNSKYVLLYFNGEFQGLYLFTEKYDRLLFDLDIEQNNVNSSLIFQPKGKKVFNNYNFDRWEQDWPNEYEGFYIMEEVLINLTNFILKTNTEEFFDKNSGIFTIFHKNNLIDFFLFNYFIDHRDFWTKNFFLVRNSYPNKFFLIPWDYDGSFGQYGWNLYDVESNPEEFIKSHNYLLNRLLTNEEFMNETRNRWKYLRETLWTDQYILDIIFDIYNKIKFALELDAHIWDPAIKVYFNEDWKNEVKVYFEHLIEYIPKRLAFCDQIFFEIY